MIRSIDRCGTSLRCSSEPTSGGGSAFIAQLTLYSEALGVAIAQACYATGDNHERAVVQKLLGELDLEGVLIQADALHTASVFRQFNEQGADFLLHAKPTSRLSTGRSPLSWLESARSLSSQVITKSVMGGTSPGISELRRHQHTSKRTGIVPAGLRK
jgi:hypothetical protein